jgi:hypothetical protein
MGVMPESPRYLVTVGRYEAALEVLVDVRGTGCWLRKKTKAQAHPHAQEHAHALAQVHVQGWAHQQVYTAEIRAELAGYFAEAESYVEQEEKEGGG